ncbi:MAG: thiamine pyrophosphate-dependent dehydrogenase E1 component subunit alpha [bacterium]
MGLKCEDLIEIYRRMLTIRRFEERAIELYRQGLIYGYLHLYIGEEAVAVGACYALEDGDYITSTHRGHGHCIAKGGDIRLMMAELMGKETGYCKGRGGSMHIADFDRGILGANGIVGGGLPIAVGAALGSRILGTNRVALSFFGDGATNNGVFLESLNMASIWGLPVIFLCENNLYAVSTPIKEASPLEDVAERASAFNIPGVVVDGNDVMAVYEVTREAVNRARGGGGPTMIEAKTYRHLGHNVNDPGTYRDRSEVESWKGRDPISRLRKALLEQWDLGEEVAGVEREVDEAIEGAVRFAIESPSTSPEEFLGEIESI